MTLTLLSFISQIVCAFARAFYPVVKIFLRTEKSKTFFDERQQEHWNSVVEKAATLKENPHFASSATYWVHVASAGELEQVIPILRTLHEKHRVCFFLTYFSPSTKPFLKNCVGLIGATSLPWEQPQLYRAAIKNLAIRRLILVRYDFWPALISEFHKSNLPLSIVAATLRKARSPLPDFFQEALRRFWFNLSDSIFLVSTTEKNALNSENFSAQKMYVAGDAKWVRAKERAAKVRRNTVSQPIQKLQNALKDPDSSNTRRVVVFGSPHREELQTLKKLLTDVNSHSEIVYIVAPHEVDTSTIESFIDDLKNPSVIFCKISEAGRDDWLGALEEHDKTTVIVLDTFGFLAESYGLADLAIVGGGFDGQLHNVLEPTAFPVLTLFGNRATRAPEAQILLTNNAAVGFSTPELLFQFLHRWSTLNRDDAVRSEMLQKHTEVCKNATSLFASLPDTSEVVCQALASLDALEAL